ncbi:MAG: type IV secretory system conjugative DNA transfer family protein [Solirubrobacterales bacterium]
MPRSNETHLNPNELDLNSQADPLAPLEHLFQWLTGTTLHIVLGALLGLLAAHLMRRRHLHWSWAAGVLVLVVLARAALVGAATTLGVGALVATARGRRWHREDLQSGADLAEIAASRTSPLDALRGAASPVRRWLAGGRIAGGRLTGSRIVDAAAELCARRSERCFRGEELTLGRDRGGRSVSIELGGEGGGTHTLVVGATGSGKTVTQTWIATRAIAHGMAAIVIDPKDDRALREQVRRAALLAGRRFIAWTPEGSSVYNPYARGGETEIADKALAAERFTEPHYQRQAQRYLGHAVRTLRAAGREVSLAGLVEALDPARLELLARDLEPERSRTVHAYLDSLTPRQRSDLTGVRDRLAIVCESDVGRWLETAGSAAESFDLLEVVRTGAVVCLSLQADRRPLLAQMLGAAIVQDLQTVVSALQSAPAPCLVVIDEFSAVAAEHVARLFGRARSAGMSLLLGTQELSDLRLPGRETLLEQVLGNLTSLIAHRQVVPDSAELIARLTGSRGAWRTTWNSGGTSTRTRVREHLLAPEEVLSLPRGCAAVIRLGGRRGVAIARMHSPERD